MRTPKHIIAILIVISLGIALYFFNLGPDETTVTDPQTGGRPATIKNQQYLDTKLSELDYYRANGVKHTAFVIADNPQEIAVAKRQNMRGEVVTSLSYSRRKTGDTITYHLYVNPDTIPPTETEELERQYTQLALIALYQSTPSSKPKSDEAMITYVSDFRKNGGGNFIFDIK